MPKTATPRKPETVSRKLAETRAKSKNRSLSSLLGIGDNEKRLATDVGSGLNDVIGRGTIAGLLGLPGDLGGAAENGLRSLLGLPQVVPYGGSEHIGQKMQDYGLVSDVRRPKTELLASLISPAQAATAGYKAPQMARAGVKALDNLASAPTMARMGQRGAIDVWHGSPREFDKFDTSENMGAGYGEQVFGRGGYHSDSEKVAKYYMDGGNGGDGSTGYLYRNQLRWPDSAREATDPLGPSHFLDWDSPLSAQPPQVKKAISSMGKDDEWRSMVREAKREGMTAGEFYELIAGDAEGQSFASELLSSYGIPGVKYLEPGISDRPSNYVTFDDNLVNIVSRNGQPVGNLGKMVAPQDEALRVAQANAAKPVEIIDIRPPKENLSRVISANTTAGKVVGDSVMPIDKLVGGVGREVSDLRRVDDLAAKMSAPDGYLERLIVDDAGNVIEGQHRLEALRKIGVKDVPVTVIRDSARGFPSAKVEDAIKAAQPMRSDHVNQISSYLASALADEGGDVSKLMQYQPPRGYEAAWKAGLDALLKP